MQKKFDINNQKGFSLIETSIGLLIFGLIGIAILTSLAASARSNVINTHLTTAESLARAQMEYIQSQPYNYENNGTSHPTAYALISLPVGYSFATSSANMATRINAIGNPVTTDAGLQQIIVSVNYDNKTIYTVTDYKANK